MAVYSGPGPLTAAFLIREANGMYRSREEADVDGGLTGLQPGTLLQRDGVTGLYTRLTPTGTVAGILWEGIAESETAPNIVRRTVVVRDAEVHKTELVYAADATAAQIVTADTGLRALGLIPRL